MTKVQLELIDESTNFYALYKRPPILMIRMQDDRLWLWGRLNNGLRYRLQDRFTSELGLGLENRLRERLIELLFGALACTGLREIEKWNLQKSKKSE